MYQKVVLPFLSVNFNFFRQVLSWEHWEGRCCHRRRKCHNLSGQELQFLLETSGQECVQWVCGRHYKQVFSYMAGQSEGELHFEEGQKHLWGFQEHTHWRCAVYIWGRTPWWRNAIWRAKWWVWPCVNNIVSFFQRECTFGWWRRLVNR